MIAYKVYLGLQFGDIQRGYSRLSSWGHYVWLTLRDQWSNCFLYSPLNTPFNWKGYVNLDREQHCQCGAFLSKFLEKTEWLFIIYSIRCLKRAPFRWSSRKTSERSQEPWKREPYLTKVSSFTSFAFSLYLFPFDFTRLEVTWHDNLMEVHMNWSIFLTICDLTPLFCLIVHC